ncbi:MAG: tetraacyldisaccharide 4'-kinase [Nitrospirota bacterium]
MYGRKSSGIPGALLFFISLFYGTAVHLRALAYGWGLLRTRELPLPVISVGNITLGGTGKTPATVNITGILLKHGRKPVVLSRGYGRSDRSAVLVVSDGIATPLDPVSGGDEPVLIARRHPGVPVVVGADRYRSGTVAIGRFHPDIAVLDDGFQHIRLQRDLNIVLIDAVDPFGSGKLFPAGILREPLTALKRADIVLITRADRIENVTLLKARIRQFTGAPIFTARYSPKDLMNVATGETQPLDFLAGKPVFAFAGIARPDSFISLLQTLGADISGTAVFPDHYSYTRSDLADLVRKADECNSALLVTTEKDGVRLKDLAPKGIFAVRIDLEVVEHNAWEEALLKAL